MNESMLSKNYLLGAKISFLIISFMICIIAVTVQNDVWPFLQTSLPMEEGKLWPSLGIIIGGGFPTIWLFYDWSNKALRYSLLSLITMLLLQTLTELLVSYYFFITMVVPTSILYVGYRIIQLVNLQKILHKTTYPSRKMKILRLMIVGINFVFWSVLWVKVTFFTFPQIIYQIF